MKTTEIRELFGRNLEKWMKRRGINQQRLADISGLSSGHLSEVRRGISGIGLDGLAQIAAALQIQPWELIVDDEATRREVFERALSAPTAEASAPPPMRRRKNGVPG